MDRRAILGRAERLLIRVPRAILGERVLLAARDLAVRLLIRVQRALQVLLATMAQLARRARLV